MEINLETYQSPFTWRYGSAEMRQIWSEANKRRTWRKVWVALAEVQSEYGLITPEQLADLRQAETRIDISRALEIEAEIQHDLMAELLTFTEQAPLGGSRLHLGATSMDIEDNADVLRLGQALDIILAKLRQVLSALAEKVEVWAELPIMAFTHLQPAEPTTLGYRMAGYAQDLWEDYELIARVRSNLRGKGFKGAVGTSAAYAELIGLDQLEPFEQRITEVLALPFYPITTQTYPRQQDYRVLSALAGLGGALYKFAFDLRLLQSPVLGELREPFGSRQVGSSAMPFKRNPINAEKIDSLGRYLAQLPRIAWDNAAHSLLERTLDDSANRRILLPEAFLAADEILRTAEQIIRNLEIDESAMQRNLAAYGPFAAVERVLMAYSKAGGDRQAAHERLRRYAMTAWEAIQAGQSNPLRALIINDAEFSTVLGNHDLEVLMDASQYVGDAPRRARQMAARLRTDLQITPE
ncbi:MAG TPA: adenylosuccinate lyase [Anaerolineales bacterium]|nr:adenylosuccinate lyase [Anaerolineales bacterium]